MCYAVKTCSGSGLVPILREKGELQLVLKVVPSHTFRCSDKYQPTSGFGIGLWPFLPLLDLQSSFRGTELACDLFSIFQDSYSPLFYQNTFSRERSDQEKVLTLSGLLLGLSWLNTVHATNP